MNQWGRELSVTLPYPPLQEELGALMETLVMGEVKAYLSYNCLRYKPYFWRTHDGTEVDLLVEIRNGFVAVEIKAARQWQRRFNTGLRRLREALPNVTAHGIYRGERPATVDDIHIHPCRDFLEKLWEGQIIS